MGPRLERNRALRVDVPRQSAKEAKLEGIDIDEFWSRLKSVNAGLLCSTDDAARLVPMSHQLRDGDGTLWFITGRGTDLAKAAAGGTEARYVLAESGKGLYAVVTGSLTRSDDRAVLNDLWSPVVGAWFEGGKDDPEVCLLALRAVTAEVWLTPTSGLTFAFGILRAQVTGSQPDMGSYGTVSGRDLVNARVA